MSVLNFDEKSLMRALHLDQSRRCELMMEEDHQSPKVHHVWWACFALMVWLDDLLIICWRRRWSRIPQLCSFWTLWSHFGFVDGLTHLAPGSLARRSHSSHLLELKLGWLGCWIKIFMSDRIILSITAWPPDPRACVFHLKSICGPNSELYCLKGGCFGHFRWWFQTSYPSSSVACHNMYLWAHLRATHPSPLHLGSAPSYCSSFLADLQSKMWISSWSAHNHFWFCSSWNRT